MRTACLKAAHFILAFVVVSLCCGVFLGQNNWPRFRGPAGHGVAPDDRNLPERWSATDNVSWATELPGRGWSSPIVWGKRIFVTSAISKGIFKEPSPGMYADDTIRELIEQGYSEEEAIRKLRERDLEKTKEISRPILWMVYSLAVEDGSIVWEREVHRGLPYGGRHRKNSYASETPITDGERVYAYFGNVGLFCFSMDGELLWSRKWLPRKIHLDLGTSSSPVLHEGRLYILNDNQEDSFIAAVDALTGKEIWVSPRSSRRKTHRADQNSGWSTPYIWKNKVRTEIVALGPATLISYDLTGQELWRFKGTSFAPVPTPLSNGGLLFVASGETSENVRPLLAIRPGASGDISLKEDEDTNKYVAWYQKRAGPYIPSPIAYGDHVYVLYDKGFFAAFEAETGKQAYKVRLGRGGNTFSSSPWAYNGKVFCLSEAGDTFVIKAGSEFQLEAKNSLDEMSLATPAIADGSLYIRTTTRLYRIRN